LGGAKTHQFDLLILIRSIKKEKARSSALHQCARSSAAAHWPTLVCGSSSSASSLHAARLEEEEGALARSAEQTTLLILMMITVINQSILHI